jgi:phosphatidylinositol glycan class F
MSATCYWSLKSSERLVCSTYTIDSSSKPEMPAKRAKATTSTSADKVAVLSSTDVPQNAFFPFARYTSVVGVHTSLVAFTALFLPQTSRLFWQPETRGTNRPQTEFLDVLTDSPAITLAWIIAGLLILQPWWAGWVRQWSFEYTSRGTADQIKVEKQRFQQGRFSVCLLTKCTSHFELLISHRN